MRHFESDLDQLKIRLFEMSPLVESAIGRSITAVVEKNDSPAMTVLRDEARVNLMQTVIDNLAVKLLALQQPIVTGNLERIADNSTNIAEDVLFYLEGVDVRPHGEARE